MLPKGSISMVEKIKNVSQHPKVYFGLHMVEGVAHYKPDDADPFTILVGEQTIKSLDPSFTGKPVYVFHVDEVNLDDLEKEADGYVVKSFYNPCDGKHWAEFLIVSDRGHESIKMGWKLSNAYAVNQYGAGGCWHGVDYSKEVLNANYEHLAIVPDPKYAESIICTPEEFKAYNEKKKYELELLKNSNNKKITGVNTMFNMFKKTKIENSIDLNEIMLTLPKSGRDVTLAQLVELAEQEPSAKTILNSSHDIYKVGKIKMTAKQLVDEYAKIINVSDDEKDAYSNMGDEEKKAYDKKNMSDEEYKKKYSNTDDDDEKKKAYDNMDDEEKKAYDKKNMSDEDYKKKYKEENEEDEDEEKKKQNKNKVANAEKALEKAKKEEENFNKIANAEINANSESAQTVDLGSDKTARGKARYGSN